ncbi:ferrochelatase [Roseospira marina]|uniref:Ferrochelatase n=1 Tax=Roseospira marina TaxID=140057 RepID=A0A5M6IEP7_9PROT|nr:ferrochelatase [Roseospira marina]KAA5606239.1 ferrochelatase [Roseospira marina]MBB4314391.1 ferrochelatase [Roseospira marina]MBB5087551.1 ferrochelatase [Roseospira marina]
MSRLAVVLFNLGGPDSLDAVKPFLFNLFNDPAIIGAPGPLRWLLARLISSRRAPIARAIYAQIGGRSPLVEQTQAQADALQAALTERDLGTEIGVFMAMRYWHPLTRETVDRVKAFRPDTVVLLPLYPQYSGSTSGSSLNTWVKTAARRGLKAETHTICCYPTEHGFVTALAELTRAGFIEGSDHGRPRVLFSAHGLPKVSVERGDPYQSQVEMTAAAIVDAMGLPNLDWVVCYQSRVGPLEWLGPDTDSEIERAGHDGVPVVVVPLAFVSEHSETLVELDIEYGELAEHRGVPAYVRVPTVQAHGAFIRGLADLVEQSVRPTEGDGCLIEAGPAQGRLCSQVGARVCDGKWSKCPHVAPSADKT